MKNEKREKIRVIYPDAKSECLANVSATYRNALRFIGVEAVRALGICRNSINIVSTADEIERSTGKREGLIDPIMGRDGVEYYICTQFGTKDKYRILTEVKEKLCPTMRIRRVEDLTTSDEVVEVNGSKIFIEDGEVKVLLSEEIRRSGYMTVEEMRAIIKAEVAMIYRLD